MEGIQYQIPERRQEVINTQNLYEQFWLAVQNGQLEKAEYCIQEGAYIFKGDFLGKNALHIAAEHGQFTMLEFLLSHGEEALEMTDIEGNTPLDYAKNSGCNDCYNLLESRIKGISIEIDAKTDILNEENALALTNNIETNYINVLDHSGEIIETENTLYDSDSKLAIDSIQHMQPI